MTPQTGKSPLNILISLILTAFVIFVIYDIAFRGGATAAVALTLAKKYFFRFVDILQALSDKYLGPFRFVP